MAEISPVLAAFEKALKGPERPFAFTRLLLLDKIHEQTELLESVYRGLDTRSLDVFVDATRLAWSEAADLLHVSLRTLERRRKQVERLTRSESDHLVRVARVVGRAFELFGDDLAAAMGWLRSPHAALDGRTPLELAQTDVGSRAVENLIGQLEHGVFL